VEHSAPRGAVFLSYASQDATAVRRICDALRAAGVEVWFDESELVGGDAWDAKIRRQIRECALFVPVISANTQARGEGYFRLEWKLAVDRSHLMAADQPFLLPVVIDDTPNEAARVPDEFYAVQWMLLPLPPAPGPGPVEGPGGDGIGEFCTVVRNLLALSMARGLPTSPPSGTRSQFGSRPQFGTRSQFGSVPPFGTSPPFAPAGSAVPASPPPKSGLPLWVRGALAAGVAAVAAVGYFVWLRPGAKEAPHLRRTEPFARAGDPDAEADGFGARQIHRGAAVRESQPGQGERVLRRRHA
jgi:hypothetical protein